MALSQSSTTVTPTQLASSHSSMEPMLVASWPSLMARMPVDSSQLPMEATLAKSNLSRLILVPWLLQTATTTLVALLLSTKVSRKTHLDS